MSQVIHTENATIVPLDNIADEQLALNDAADNAAKWRGDALENSNCLITDLSNHKTDWLLDGSIIKNTLVCFYAKAGMGKSNAVLALAAHMLRTNKVQKVRYYDGDNGLATLKMRNIDALVNDLANDGQALKYMCFEAGDDDIEQKKLLAIEAQACALDAEYAKSCADVLLVIDSIRNFFDGDMINDGDVQENLDILRKLRKYYAGVWFLHHTPKSAPTAPKGSSGFIDLSDSLIEVQKISNSIADNQMLVTCKIEVKARNGERSFAYNIDTSNYTITPVDFYSVAFTPKQLETIAMAKLALIGKELSQADLIDAIEQVADNHDKKKQICGKTNRHKLLAEHGAFFFNVRPDYSKSAGRPSLMYSLK